MKAGDLAIYWRWLAGSQEVSYKHLGDGFDSHIANQWVNGYDGCEVASESR